MKYVPKHFFYFENQIYREIGIKKAYEGALYDSSWLKFAKNFEYLIEYDKLSPFGFDINETFHFLKYKFKNLYKEKQTFNFENLNSNNTLIVISCDRNCFYYYPTDYENYILSIENLNTKVY